MNAMTNFTSDQWVIVALVFLLGLLVGGFLFSGGGRKWKTRYNAEAERRKEIEAQHAQREREWREQDSLRAAALRNNPRDSAGVSPAGDDIRRTHELHREERLRDEDIRRDRDGRPL
jgi:hypothetical protein